MGSLGDDAKTSLPPLGLLVSSMNICRVPGDVGNERTFDFPVIQEMAQDSLLVRMVSDDKYDEDFLENFIVAGKKLVERGAVGIITSCGFLAMAQKEFAKNLSVPVAASSLLQIPIIRSTLREDQEIGIITFDAQRLNKKHLHAIGISDTESIFITGPPAEGKMKVCLRDGKPYNLEELTAELVATAKKLVAERPKLGAIVLECTQFPPFGKAIQDATGLPVYDVFTLGSWFYSGLVRKHFPVMSQEELDDAAVQRPRSDRELMESKMTPAK